MLDPRDDISAMSGSTQVEDEEVGVGKGEEHGSSSMALVVWSLDPRVEAWNRAGVRKVVDKRVKKSIAITII
jgi:hypothetical protein